MESKIMVKLNIHCLSGIPTHSTTIYIEDTPLVNIVGDGRENRYFELLDNKSQEINLTIECKPQIENKPSKNIILNILSTFINLIILNFSTNISYDFDCWEYYKTFSIKIKSKFDNLSLNIKISENSKQFAKAQISVIGKGCTVVSKEICEKVSTHYVCERFKEYKLFQRRITLLSVILFLLIAVLGFFHENYTTICMSVGLSLLFTALYFISRSKLKRLMQKYLNLK